MPPPPDRTSAAACASVAGAAVAVDVVLVAGFGSESGAGQWWTSVGLWSATLAVAGPRRWPVLAVVMAVTGGVLRLAVGGDPGPVAGGTAVRVVEAVVAAAVLTRGGRRAPQLRRVRDLWLLLAAAVAAGVVSAAQVGVHAPGGAERMEDGLVENFCQHALSVLLAAALVLAARDARPRHFSRRASLELGVQAALLTGVTALVFGPGGEDPLLVLPVPVLVWAALRWPPVVATAEAAVYAGVVTTLTAAGHGAMRAELVGDDRSGPMVLAYVVSVLVIVLPLAVAQQQRRRLVDRLASDERLFRRNFTESPLGMMLLLQREGELVVTDLNLAARTILGTDDDTAAGLPLSGLVDLGGAAAHGFARLLAGGSDSWHGQAAVVGRPGSRLEVAIAALDRRDGALRYSAQLLDVSQEHEAHRRLEVAIAALDRRDGALRYSAQLLDVSQEHEAHRRLAAAHRLNDATFDTTAAIILVADAAGTVVRANAATSRITGFAPDDLVGYRVWDLPLGALTRAETEALFVWPNRSGYPVVSERVGRTAAGDPLQVVWSNNIVRDEQGRPAYAVITGTDVTSERTSAGLVQHLLSARIATALIGVDGTGRITLVNAGAAHLLGWSAEELVGQPFVRLFDPQQMRSRTGAVGDHDAFLSLVGTIGDGDGDDSPLRDWTWRTSSGAELVVAMTLSVTQDLGEDRMGFLCVGRDVTEQRAAQETLVAALEKERTAVERLRELDRARDELVSTVSHELRTPVTSILGYVELLRDGTFTDPAPEQVPVLERIERNGERLVTICNDLLLLSGFDADSAAVVGVRTRVDLRECLLAARELLEVAADDHALEVHLRPGHVGLEVAGDRGQLDRIVENLVSNAVKFTPAGGRVEVELARDDDHAVLVVRDSGIGIPRSDHDAVFDRFYRTEQAQVRAIPGTGLGLPIVAAVVEGHGGRIELESEPDRGTTFRVRLPLTGGGAVTPPPVQDDEVRTSG